MTLRIFSTIPNELFVKICDYLTIGELGNLEQSCTEFRTRIASLWNSCANSIHLQGENLKIRTLKFFHEIKKDFGLLALEQIPENVSISSITCKILKNYLQDIPLLMTNLDVLRIDLLAIWKKLAGNVSIVFTSEVPMFKETKRLFKKWCIENRNQLKQLDSLRLEGLNLQFIPAEIWDLSKLEDLILSDNLLVKIPSEISYLTKLQHVNLDSNNLDTLAPLCELFNLRSLSANNNIIKNILPEIVNLKKLRSLKLEDNLITRIPDDIDKLKNLRLLDLDSNAIAQIPASLGNLQELACLSLFGNLIEDIPDEISSLKKLVALELGGNKIKTVTPKIGALSSMKKLSLVDNELSELPKEISQLLWLKKLFLDGNEFPSLAKLQEHLPPQIEELTYDENPFNMEPSLKKLKGK